MSSVIRKYAALCIVCLCSSLFFLGLYHFDNKYSQNTIQAANGILALSENDLKKSPVRFLVSGWEFYPDALLTPEEIQDSEQSTDHKPEHKKFSKINHGQYNVVKSIEEHCDKP